MRRLPASLALAVTVCVSDLAAAYVLPADFLLRMLADRRRDLGMKDLSLTLTAELDGVDTPVDERLYLQAPLRLRYVRQDEDATHVVVEREGRRAAGPEGALRLVPNAPPDLTAALLVPAGKDLDELSANMLAAVQQAGIDTSVVTLGRDGDTIAYIIGARVFETDKPQLWLYKSSFLPMRQVLRGKDGKKRETRWLEWGASVTGDYFPLVVEDYEDGELVRRAEVQKATANQKLPETLFDLPQ